MKKMFLICALLITNLSSAQNIVSAYLRAPSSFKDILGSVKVVPNMPKIRSQSPLGLCYAFSNATILQKYYCDDVKIKNCADVSLDETVSPVAITGLKQPIAGKTNASDRLTYAHAFLPTTIDTSGGGESNLLQMASVHHSFCAESFFPYDQFVGMNNFSHLDSITARNEMEKLANNKISQLENTYNKYHQMYKTNAASVESCTECLKEINRIVQTDDRDFQIRKSFQKNTFQEFLFEAFFKFCNKKVSLTTPTFDYYPKDAIFVQKEKYYFDKNHPVKILILNKIKKVINNNVPVQIGFCAEKAGDVCTGPHSTVIAGYKKVCNENNQCEDMLKIHNSSGTGWQQRNDDGWVIADNILSSFEGVGDKNRIGIASLSWISKGAID